MSRTLLLFLIGTVFLIPVCTYAQKGERIENGAVYKFKKLWYKHNEIAGTLLSTEGSKHTLESIKGDTVVIPADSARKVYLPEQIRLYRKGNYHYSQGKIKNFSLGFGQDHFNLDFVYGIRYNNRLDVGLGAGLDHNTAYFYTTSDAHAINIVGSPIFIQGKYALTLSRKCIYLKSRIGLTNNSETANIISIQNGLLFEGGAGVLFASKTRMRFYMEMSQYISHAKGVVDIPSPDILSDVEFNIWFYRFLFTLGLEFGK